jgi:hypothetical protein
MNNRKMDENRSISDLGSDIWSSTEERPFEGMQLTSLVGCPKVSPSSLFLRGNRLTSLEGSPTEIMGCFDIGRTYTVKSLVGGPTIVHGYYDASGCGLTSLDGLPIKIGAFLTISQNEIESLQGINKLKEMDGAIYMSNCPITSHILGVFFINGCQGILASNNNDLDEAINIVNRHIKKGRAGLLPCQKELIEAGLADFAQV